MILTCIKNIFIAFVTCSCISRRNRQTETTIISPSESKIHTEMSNNITPSVKEESEDSWSDLEEAISNTNLDIKNRQPYIS